MMHSMFRSGHRRIAAIMTKGLMALMAMAFAPDQVMAQAAAGNEAAQLVAVPQPMRASFDKERASKQARHIADWVVHSGDNGGMPFAIVDKMDARVFVFDDLGRLRGAAPALIGLARGDDAVPDIGTRPLASIRPEERTTPAGRFVSALGRNLQGREILWVDYDGAVSMHPVVKGTPAERREQRLSSPTPLDNRISYGCINVPLKFFDNVVRPAFTGTKGIVYVLPDTRSVREVFASYDVDGHTPPRRHAGVAVHPAQPARH